MTLRSVASLLVASGLVFCVAAAAPAAVTIEFVWTSSTGAGVPGGASIAAVPGDQLVGEVRVTPDAGGVGAYSVSLAFDSDLGDELDLVGVSEFLPGVMEYNFSPGAVESTAESTGASAGSVDSIEAVVLTVPGPTSGSFVAAEVTFAVTANVATDGDDVFLGAFNSPVDGVGDNAYALVTPVFVHAAVDQGAVAIPSLSRPALVALPLCIALAALLLLRRRRAGALLGRG